MIKKLISTILIMTMILTSANLAIYAETEGADGQNTEITEQGQSSGGDETGTPSENNNSDSGEAGEPGDGGESGTETGQPGSEGGSTDSGEGTSGGTGSGDSDVDNPEDDPEEPDVTEVKVENLVSVNRGVTTHRLNWDEIPQAESFKVYRGVGLDKTSFSLIATVDTNTYVDKSLRGGWNYRYKVVPVLKQEYVEKGVMAYASDVLVVKMKWGDFNKRIPYLMVKNYKDPDVGLKAYNTVQWEAVPDAKGYVVYRASKKAGKYEKIATVTGALKYNDKLAPSGKYAYYKVRAYKGKLTKTYSKYSDIKSIKTIIRVFIACGHGMQTNGVWDGGCTYKGMSEAKLMLPITKAMVAEMRASGVYVYTDADKDNNLNMTYCVRNANRSSVSVYMSIHCDYSGAPKGTLPLYYSKNDLVLAKALNKGVHGEVDIADRKPQRRWDLFELRTPKAKACCIFETGSIRYDNSLFRKKPKAYGRGLAKGLCSYLGVEYVGVKK